MMNYFIPKAFAIGLADIGGGVATSVWVQICTMIPCAPATGNLVETITTIVGNFILWTIGPAAVLIILYASIRLITSAGNDETVRKAWKEMIFYAVLGLILAVLASVIINWVYNLATWIAAL